MKLFGTAGIRGPLDKVSPEFTLHLGESVATYLDYKGKVVVGTDHRVSNKMLESAFVSGLISRGVDVELIGIVPTPVLSFASRREEYNLGIMITASHNPPGDNGFKVFKKGRELTRKEEAELESIFDKRDFAAVDYRNIGKITYRDDFIDKYIDSIKERIPKIPTKKTVVDCGNGTANLVIPKLLGEYGCEIILFNKEINGFFPGRPSEPTPENIEEARKAVLEYGVDLGLAYDGDADRVAVVDEKGEIVPDDLLIAFFAKKITEENKGGTVVTAINTSVAIEEVAEAAGGKVVRVPVGCQHEGLEEHDAVFCAEPWKLIFPKFGNWIDGIYTTFKLLEACGDNEVSSLFSALPRKYMVKKSFYFKKEEQMDIYNSLKEKLLKEYSSRNDVRDIVTIDGIRVNFKNRSWLLARASGTEPKIRIRAEGSSAEEAEKLFSEINSLLASCHFRKV